MEDDEEDKDKDGKDLGVGRQRVSKDNKYVSSTVHLP